MRNLKISLKNEFDKANLKVGRDTLFNILRKHNMLITRKKPSYRTTNSFHRFYKHKNIIKDVLVNRPNQVWVSDITYIRTVKGFCYLALITDMYSRKIIGYDLSDSLELSGCTRALKKALYQAKNTESLIHQSDRGIQYCSNVYTQIRLNVSLDYRTPNMVYLKNSVNQFLTCSHISGLDIRKMSKIQDKMFIEIRNKEIFNQAQQYPF